MNDQQPPFREVKSSVGGVRLKSISSLGKEMKISPKSTINIYESGYTATFFTETVEVLIGIGNDHVARVVMDVEAYEALKNGEKLHTTSWVETRRGGKKKKRKDGSI